MNANAFLIQCYFGDVSNPTLAAIDRAYLDMQAHTISGDKETVIFPGRKKITEILYKELTKITPEVEFDQWHKKLSDEIKRNYSQLTYGQIQKWLNMSIKYLFTLKSLGVAGINEFWSEKNADKFHAPLDSYVLNAINKGDGVAPKWSKIPSYDEYLKQKKKITFEEEYEHWPEYAKNGLKKKTDKGTYKRWLQNLPENAGYDFEKESD